MTKRILALLLCVLVLMSLVPSSIFAAEEEHVCDTSCEHTAETAGELTEAELLDEDADQITVTFQGTPVSELAMAKYERSTLTAKTALRGRTSCRWQILADAECELWVDIYGEDEASLTVSYAMVATVLDSDNRTWVRCVYETESGEKYGEPIRITVLPPAEAPEILEEETTKESVVEPETAPTESATEAGTEPATEAATEPATEAATEPATEAATEPATEEVTEPATEAVTEPVTEKTEEIVEASAEETAEAAEPATEAVKSTADTAAVENASAAMPMAEGDDPAQNDVIDESVKKYILSITYVYGKGTVLEGKVAASPWIAELSANQAFKDTIESPTIPGFVANPLSVTFEYAAGALTGNVNRVVEYTPGNVNYTVNHRLQNVNDDKYDEIHTETAEGLTESVVPDNLGREYEGFEMLPYITDKIAANGSTVVDIYYDRLYYLMTFELDGGYGTEPIFARYGAKLEEVVEPQKAGYEFGGWKTSAEGDETIDLPETMPAGGGKYYAHWIEQTASYSVAYWLVNDDGTRSLIGTRVTSGTTDSEVDGIGDLGTADVNGARICGFDNEHTHKDGCYSCGEEAHAHTVSCFDNMGRTEMGAYDNARLIIQDLESGAPESGYIYVIKGSSGQYWPKTYVEDANGTGKFYNLQNVQGGWTQDSYASIIDGDVTKPLADKAGYYRDRTNNGAAEYLTVYKYKAKANCNITQHLHDDSKLTCGQHGHSEGCYFDPKHADFQQTVTVKDENGNDVTYTTDQDVEIRGDGTTIVNVYYTYREYTIRFVYARSDKDGGSLHLAANTGNGSLTGATWDPISQLPSVTDPNNGTTPRYFEEGNHRYYYIALTARYGDNIADKWPSANVDPVGGYKWGSWAAAQGTGYRTKYGDSHANIVGPYPLMSDDMIVKDPQKITDVDTTSPEYGTYLAQNMNAWWGGGNANISKHAYHNYFEVSLSEKLDTDVYYDPDETDGIDGKYYRLDPDRSFVFTAAHNGSTRVDPVQFDGYTIVNEEHYKQGDSKEFDNKGNCDICGDDCDYCNTFYYDANKYKLTFWNYDDYLSDGSGAEVPCGELLTKRFRGITVNDVTYKGANDLVVDKYPKSLEEGAYRFEAWYTSAQFEPETRVNEETMRMPAENTIVYANWVPVTYTVTVEVDMGTETKEYEFEISHGKTVLDGMGDPSLLPQKPTESPLGKFVGWFYMDGDVEKAFDFENTPVTQDTFVYAKWKSNLIKDVTVRYVTVVDGNEVEIAPTETHKAYVGSLKTYEAKTEDQLDEGYREKYYPNVSTQSITVSDVGSNVVTFTYTNKPSVPYSVYYWVKEENGDLRPAFRKAANADGYVFVDAGEAIPEGDEIYSRYYPDNEKEVVTEFFIPVDDYIPDAREHRLVVSLKEDENVINFIYTYDPNSEYYTVNHYVAKSTVENPTSEDDFELYTNSEILGTVHETYKSGPMSITGVTFSEELTEQWKGTNTWDAVNQELSLVLEKGDDAALNFYYVRNKYSYTVYYLEEDTNLTLKDSKSGEALYGSTVSETAPSIEKYKVVGASTKSCSISDYEFQNVITFYYTRMKGNLEIKKTVSLDEEQAAEDSSLKLPDNADEIPFSFTVMAEDVFHTDSYSYTITRKDGTVETGTVTVKDNLYKELKPITLCDGDKVVIEGLALGGYTVKEEHVVGYKTTINGYEREYIVLEMESDGQELTANVINTYPFYTGDLLLEKTVKLGEAVLNTDKTFTFTITVRPEAGTLDEQRIIKYLTVDENGDQVEETYTIGIGEYDKTHKFELKLKAGTSVIVSDVPAGDFTVVETIDSEHYATEYYKVVYDKKTGQEDTVIGQKEIVNGVIQGGHTTTVGYTNTCKNDGQLTIHKTVTQEVDYDNWTEDTFTFAVTGITQLPAGEYDIKIGTEDGKAIVDEDGNVTLSINPTVEVTKSDDPEEKSWSNSLIIKQLPAGTYTVEEIETDLGLEKYTVTPESKKVENLELLGKTMTADADIVNQYKRTSGELKISKEIQIVIGGATPTEGEEFTFIVHMPDDGDFNGKIYTGTTSDDATKFYTVVDDQLKVTMKRDEHITLHGMPIGVYQIEEEQIPGYEDSYRVTDQNGDVLSEIRVKTGELTTVACINRYPVYKGVLTIDRTSSADPEQVFVYEIRLKDDGDDASDDLVMQVTVVGNGETTVRGLPYGTYTVTQLNDGWSWRYADGSQEVTLTADDDKETLEFGGSATEKWLDGCSPLIKNRYKKKEGDGE